MDGDGVVDLAVGAPGDDDGTEDAGAVWLLFLNTNGTVKSRQKISAQAGNFGGDLDQEDNVIVYRLTQAEGRGSEVL